jgi:hypothetical protein
MTECRAGRDGCAVPTPALACLVREWETRWNRDHPDLVSARRTNGRRIGGGGTNADGQLAGNRTVGAVTILHERTRQVDPRERGVSKRQIRAMLSQRAGAYTELRTADLIVAAVERPDAFHDGSLPVVPNPWAGQGHGSVATHHQPE